MVSGFLLFSIYFLTGYTEKQIKYENLYSFVQGVPNHNIVKQGEAMLTFVKPIISIKVSNWRTLYDEPLYLRSALF